MLRADQSMFSPKASVGKSAMIEHGTWDGVGRGNTIWVCIVIDPPQNGLDYARLVLFHPFFLLSGIKLGLFEPLSIWRSLNNFPEFGITVLTFASQSILLQRVKSTRMGSARGFSHCSRPPNVEIAWDELSSGSALWTDEECEDNWNFTRQERFGIYGFNRIGNQLVTSDIVLLGQIGRCRDAPCNETTHLWVS